MHMRLARWKLGKKNTPQSWRPPSPYVHHGALLPAPPHTAISQHAAQQVYVINYVLGKQSSGAYFKVQVPEEDGG